MGRGLAAAFPDPLGNMQTAVQNLPAGHTKQAILVLIEKTKRDTAPLSEKVIAAEPQLETLQENLGQWR